MNGSGRNALPWTDLAARGEVGLLLIRHASTAWNRARRMLGRTDLPLDAEGHGQALALARFLASTPLSGLHSSPLLRAVQTAEALAADRALSIQIAPDLIEISHGELEGLGTADLLPRYADFFAAWRADPGATRVPGGETLGEVQARVLPALCAIAVAHQPGAPVAIVLHQMALSAALCGVEGVPLRDYSQFSQPNTAITLLAAREGRLRLVCRGLVEHLGQGR